jgi:tetratricopeptide (TPR) repeat protein
MRIIGADYNAMTEAGHVRLTLPCSQEDISRLGLRAGDWAWLSDGEVIVGAQLAIDDRYGLVGVPDWDTIVPLDEEGADDFERIKATLDLLWTKEPPSAQDEPRILQLVTQLEYAAPPQFWEGGARELPVSFRRAVALSRMGKLGLAVLEAEEARRARPEDPEVAFVYLDLLRQENLPAAVVQADAMAESPDVPALILSACINILAAQAEQAADDQFEPVARRVLAWCQRLDQAPDLDQLGPSLVALSDFNRGFVLLRAGRISRARQAFERAQQIYPVGPMLDEVTGLQTYDRHAREVARRVRTIAEQFPTKPVAA